MNKYQKALLEITPFVFTGNASVDKKNEKALVLLQELVDKTTLENEREEKKNEG